MITGRSLTHPKSPENQNKNCTCLINAPETGQVKYYFTSPVTRLTRHVKLNRWRNYFRVALNPSRVDAKRGDYFPKPTYRYRSREDVLESLRSSETLFHCSQSCPPRRSPANRVGRDICRLTFSFVYLFPLCANIAPPTNVSTF
jgi:hypothetical protein